MVRANGSYPLCPGFKSLHRHHALLKLFRSRLKTGPLKDGQRLLLAVSGGGDSVGMLALFLSSLPRPDLALGVAHVNHRLRGGDADRDRDTVEQMASVLDLPYCAEELEGKPGMGESVEEWARIGRYAALERLRRNGGWDWTATAHSLDDQAETVLLRIARGAGPSGLAGILRVSGRVIRPVLDFTGSRLREAATECGLNFVEDATNRDRRFLRNRVRLEALPVLESVMPGFTRHLAALAGLAAEALPPPGLERFAVVEGNALYYPCAALSELNDGEGLELFRSGLRLLKGDLRRIGEKHLRALWALRKAAKGAVVSLPGKWEGVREKAGIRLRRLL